MIDDTIHLPEEWEAALACLAGRRRIVVIGATDVGKSSFVHALMARRPELALIDLDPGQKMVGPPGTVSLGRPAEGALALERFVFLGSTSSASIFHISRAAAELSDAAPFVANTSGFVRGLGARLQAVTIAALRADCIVAIGPAEALAPITAARPEVPLVSVTASPAARRKSPSLRAGIRQAAFVQALGGAVEQEFAAVAFEPGPPIARAGEHPVCALSNRQDMALGILLSVEEDRVRVLAPLTAAPTHRLRLGKMWATPAAGGWKLLDKLRPAWAQD